MTFELPPLPYSYDALEPYMSSQTLHLHHDKHHQAYVSAANDLTKGTDLEGRSLEDVMKAAFGDPARRKLFNNAGQHWNHTLFWPSMKQNGGGNIPGELEQRLRSDFGDVETFKNRFVETGVGQFGSGWVWLVVEDGKLTVTGTPNGENPVVHGRHALVGCDVWEHAYYLDYQNRRADYLKAFLDNMVDWEFVAQRLAQAD